MRDKATRRFAGKRRSSPMLPGDANRNPSGIGFFELIAEDFRTHDRDLLEGGFWAVAVHRFGNWRMGIRSKMLRAPLSLVYKLLNRFVEFCFGGKSSTFP